MDEGGAEGLGRKVAAALPPLPGGRPPLMRKTMPRRLTLRDVLVRIALAYALVAQLLLGGAATGAHAAPAVTREAGVLCAGSAPGTGGGGEVHLALCCLAGCASSAVQAMDATGGFSYVPPLRYYHTSILVDGAAGEGRAARPSGFDARGPPGRI